MHTEVCCTVHLQRQTQRTLNIKYHHVYGWFNVSRVVVIKFSNLSEWNGAHNLLIQTILGWLFLLIFSFCIGASLNLQFQLNEWNYLLWSFFLCRRFLNSIISIRIHFQLKWNSLVTNFMIVFMMGSAFSWFSEFPTQLYIQMDLKLQLLITAYQSPVQQFNETKVMQFTVAMQSYNSLPYNYITAMWLFITKIVCLKKNMLRLIGWTLAECYLSKSSIYPHNQRICTNGIFFILSISMNAWIVLANEFLFIQKIFIKLNCAIKNLTKNCFLIHFSSHKSTSIQNKRRYIQSLKCKLV